MTMFLLLVAAALGALAAVQPVINGRLGRTVGDVGLAALISLSTSTACLLLYMVVTRPELPSLETVKSGPWWMWTGGLIGAVYVAISLGIVARLGATSLASAVLFGQMMAALAADHYGWFGLTPHEISIPRLIGIAMLLGGVVLIRFY